MGRFKLFSILLLAGLLHAGASYARDWRDQIDRWTGDIVLKIVEVGGKCLEGKALPGTVRVLGVVDRNNLLMPEALDIVAVELTQALSQKLPAKVTRASNLAEIARAYDDFLAGGRELGAFSKVVSDADVSVLVVPIHSDAAEVYTEIKIWFRADDALQCAPSLSTTIELPPELLVDLADDVGSADDVGMAPGNCAPVGARVELPRTTYMPVCERPALGFALSELYTGAYKSARFTVGGALTAPLRPGTPYDLGENCRMLYLGVEGERPDWRVYVQVLCD